MQEPLSIPEDMKLFTTWLNKTREVKVKGYQTLSFETGIVYPSDPLVIECESGLRAKAEVFRTTLKVMGWKNVNICERSQLCHELGGEA